MKRKTRDSNNNNNRGYEYILNEGEYDYILDAVRMRNLELVRELLGMGADVHAQDFEGQTCLHRACRENNLNVAQLLVDHGADVNARDNDGKTPLHYEHAGEGYLNVVRFLVENGADVNAKDHNGNTPLHQVCVGGRLEVVMFLIENGAEVNATDKNGDTPLHHSCHEGGLDSVPKRITVSVENAEHMNDWHRYKAHLKVAKVLIASGANVNAKNYNGATPLHRLCWKEHCGIAQLLIESGADVTATDNDGLTPLHWSFHKGSLDKMKFLIETRYHLNEQKIKASLKEHFRVANLLLENGADVNAKGNEGETPLLELCKNFRCDTKDDADAEGVKLGVWLRMKFLLENGADVNVVEKNTGDAPMHYVCKRDCLEFVQELLIRGANVNAASKDGRTPLQVACNENHPNVVWFLVRQYPWLVAELSES